MKLFLNVILQSNIIIPLITKSELEIIDKSGMHKIYDKWPEIATKSFNTDLEPADFKDIDHIVFSGMGGSGALGDVFSSILSKKNIHVSVMKGYLLPKTVDSNTLVVSTSVSGNTLETLSVLNSSTNLDCKVIAFSSGGKMENFCLKKGIEYRKIEQKHSPRASFTSFLYSMLKVLETLLTIIAGSFISKFLNYFFFKFLKYKKSYKQNN